MQLTAGAVREVLTASIPTSSGVPRLPPILHPNLNRCLAFGMTKVAAGLDKPRSRNLLVSVRASSDSQANSGPVSPLEFESPVGLLLAQILQTHPHLLPAAIDQQLENLQNERDTIGEAQSQELLYKRIAEVKGKEKRRVLEEIIYSLVVQKFLDNNIVMIPKLSTNSSDPTGRVDFWPNQEQKLESVHSPEAFEMILSHLSIILGERNVGPLETLVQISSVKLGKLYAASIMYGYFLRRVDQRYQLERRMNALPKDFKKDQAVNERSSAAAMWDPDNMMKNPLGDVREGDYSMNDEEKSYRLRSYVMYLDGETLQRYATIRSKEAISLIEKQTQALFGRPDIRVAEDGSLNTTNDEVISVTFSGLTMLVLEAVAFGSFLWDAESYVESKYHFLNN